MYSGSCSVRLCIGLLQVWWRHHSFLHQNSLGFSRFTASGFSKNECVSFISVCTFSKHDHENAKDWHTHRIVLRIIVFSLLVGSSLSPYRLPHSISLVQYPFSHTALNSCSSNGPLHFSNSSITTSNNYIFYTNP